MKKTVSKLFILFLIVAVLAFGAIVPFGANVADAIEIGGSDIDGLWYFGDTALNLTSAREIISSWDKSRLTKKTVAVIDTGIDASHELFDGVLYEDASGKKVGYDARKQREVAVETLKDTSDNKHGNAVAGAIAILIKQLGLESVVKIYPIKANTLDDNGNEKGTFTVEPVIAGINQAMRMGADAVNMSLGRLKSESSVWATSTALKSAIINASANTLVVAAAGNDGKNADEKEGNAFYPAAHDGVLGVMAYGKNGAYANTDYGKVYGIAAPGEEVYTAKYAEGNGYQYMDGTSLASPSVAFSAALLKLRFEAEGKPLPSANACSQMLRNLEGEKFSHKNTVSSRLDLSVLLKQDFDKTDYNYSKPEKLELSHDGKLGSNTYSESIFMHASAVSPVTFVAKLQPFGKTDPDVDASVVWSLRVGDNETELSKGARFTLTPTVFGDTVIIARLRYDDLVLEAEQKIHIEYGPYLVGDVRVTYAKNAGDGVNNAPSRGILYTTETTAFSLTGIEFVDKTKPIKWFVNGEYAGEGVIFNYAPTKSGKYIISAQYGDMPATNTTYRFVAEVRSFVLRPLDLSMLIIGLVIAAGLIAVWIAIAIKRKKATNEEASLNEKDM